MRDTAIVPFTESEIPNGLANVTARCSEGYIITGFSVCIHPITGQTVFHVLLSLLESPLSSEDRQEIKSVFDRFGKKQREASLAKQQAMEKANADLHPINEPGRAAVDSEAFDRGEDTRTVASDSGSSELTSARLPDEDLDDGAGAGT